MERFIPFVLCLSTTLYAQVPIHHWPLDDGAGPVALDITGGEHGMLQNGATWLPSGGHFGGAVHFDGADDRIDVGPCDVTTGPGGLTLSVWMKAGLMAGNEQVLLGKTTGPQTSDHVWSLSQVSSTAVRFRVKAGGSVTELTTPPSSLFSGAWYHVCGTYDGSTMNLYLNGALMVSTPKTGLLPFAPQAPATMGGRADGSASFLGTLDDVRIYDHGLTEMEVIDLVIGNVSVGVEAQPLVSMLPDGRLMTPAGHWSRLEILDASGRMIGDRREVEGAVAFPLAAMRPGMYLVRLWNDQEAAPLVRPIVIASR